MSGDPGEVDCTSVEFDEEKGSVSKVEMD